MSKYFSTKISRLAFSLYLFGGASLITPIHALPDCYIDIETKCWLRQIQWFDSYESIRKQKICDEVFGQNQASEFCRSNFNDPRLCELSTKKLREIGLCQGEVKTKPQT